MTVVDVTAVKQSPTESVAFPLNLLADGDTLSVSCGVLDNTCWLLSPAGVATTGTLTVQAGDSPAALSSGQGDLDLPVDLVGSPYVQMLPCLEGARFWHEDGTVKLLWTADNEESLAIGQIEIC